MKRRQRGKPVADKIPWAVVDGLVARRTAAAVTESRDAQRRMYRARQSRNENRRRVRELDALAITTRRRADAVVAEQAQRTAGLRLALVESRQQVMELEAQACARETAAVGAGVIAGLRERLAAGNTAYSELMGIHSRLRAAFDVQQGQTRLVASHVKDWDMLCQRLYEAGRGRNVTTTDRAVLQRWSTWRKATKGITK